MTTTAQTTVAVDQGQTSLAQAATTPAPEGGQGGTSSGTAVQTQQTAANDWTSSLNDEMKAFVQTKGFKDPAMVLDSYRNVEKLIGHPKERLLTLPEKMEGAEMEGVYKRLGKPEKADGYNFQEVKDNPAPKEFVEWAKNAFHKSNLTNSQAEALLNEWNAFSNTERQNMVNQLETKGKQEVEALQAAWGNAYEQKIAIGSAGAKEFGLTVEQIDGIQQQIGYQKTMELFYNIGSKIGEAQFHTGEGKGFGAMSPDVARSQIASLKADTAFMAKYASGDKEAKDKMNRLFNDAYPGQVTL